jgi:hypothetical protein
MRAGPESSQTTQRLSTMSVAQVLPSSIWIAKILLLLLLLVSGRTSNVKIVSDKHDADCGKDQDNAAIKDQQDAPVGGQEGEKHDEEEKDEGVDETQSELKATSTPNLA